MATYLKNTLLKFNRRTVQIGGTTYSVPDYTSINIDNVRNYINSLPSNYFDWYRVDNDDKWERISLELYGNPDYWDILMILNHRNPLNGLPINFDAITNISESKVSDYETFFYKKKLPSNERNLMYQHFENNDNAENENKRVIKIILPSKINKFLQDAYDQGIF